MKTCRDDVLRMYYVAYIIVKVEFFHIKACKTLSKDVRPVQSILSKSALESTSNRSERYACTNGPVKRIYYDGPV